MISKDGPADLGGIPISLMSRKHHSPGSPRLIALVGIDGSGKTTQAQRLAAWLAESGTPARYALNAGGRRWLSRFAHGLGQSNAQQLFGVSGMLVAESVLRGLAISSALLRAHLSNAVAVMDRYSFCQYASIRAHCVWSGQGKGEQLARCAYRIFPRPDVTFLLAVDPAEAYRRIELRGTDHENLEFLIATAQAYQELPEAEDFVVIDASLGPDEVSRTIRAFLSKATCHHKT